jgi:hypothetical protein
MFAAETLSYLTKGMYEKTTILKGEVRVGGTKGISY